VSTWGGKAPQIRTAFARFFTGPHYLNVYSISQEAADAPISAASPSPLARAFCLHVRLIFCPSVCVHPCVDSNYNMAVHWSACESKDQFRACSSTGRENYKLLLLFCFSSPLAAYVLSAVSFACYPAILLLALVPPLPSSTTENNVTPVFPYLTPNCHLIWTLCAVRPLQHFLPPGCLLSLHVGGRSSLRPRGRGAARAPPFPRAGRRAHLSWPRVFPHHSVDSGPGVCGRGGLWAGSGVKNEGPVQAANGKARIRAGEALLEVSLRLLRFRSAGMGTWPSASRLVSAVGQQLIGNIEATHTIRIKRCAVPKWWC
jgi:hypothetical protein